jgi:anti-sigma regulatory factor (Ser/Thr protein kinase)
MEVNPAPASVVVAVRDSSEVGAARRAAVSAADALGFAETETGRVALVATELATNLVRHGGGGELLVRQVPEIGVVELVAIDRGPGMASIERALRDGYSTGGTQGTGLGAVRRLADDWDLFSAPGAGTAVMARVGGRGIRGPTADGDLRVAGVSLPAPGETACGDAWAWRLGAGRWMLLVADGLGHGKLAAVAATEAVHVFEAHPNASVTELLHLAHGALRPTRGAAVAIAEVVPSQGTLSFAGIGNIAGVILTAGTTRSLVSQPGIVGHECRRVQAFSYRWSEESVLVMHSDGLQSRWTLDRYPALAARDPALLAAVLYRDYARGRDDVTVVCAREGRAA